MKKSAEWKALKARDVARASELNLRSFDTKKMKGVLICYNCHKACCFFAKESNDEYVEASKALKLNMEDISFRYSCGDLVFNDDHPVSKVICQRRALNYEAEIEKAYYNSKERALKLPDICICIHCGGGGSNNFLLWR